MTSFSSFFVVLLLVYCLLVFGFQEDVPRLVRVDKILGRTGSRGGVIQVKVQFIDDETRYVVLPFPYCQACFVFFSLVAVIGVFH